MKAEILRLLREADDYVSGQFLCEHFGVSRTAVWKAIEQLKKSGYEIEGIRNKGYRLVEADTDTPDTNCYGKAEIESRMTTKYLGRQVVFFAETDSTNQKAKLFGEEHRENGTLVVAEHQTLGKGRRGRKWESPEGENIYMSLLLYPQIQTSSAPQLTLVMAMAVAKGIQEVYGTEVGIKWPNDVVLSGKKICGILTEMSLEAEFISYVVIGVGLNVAQQEFPQEIRDKATSLLLETQKSVSRSELIAEVLRHFEDLYERFLIKENLSDLREEYNALLLNRGKEVRISTPKEEYTATGLGINDTGELLVRLEDGSERAIYAGEVSVRGLYGYV